MDTIDEHTMALASDAVDETRILNSKITIHTVTITLNGQHGGADVIIQGTVPDVRGGSWGDVEYVKEVR